MVKQDGVEGHYRTTNLSLCLEFPSGDTTFLSLSFLTLKTTSIMPTSQTTAGIRGDNRAITKPSIIINTVDCLKILFLFSSLLYCATNHCKFQIKSVIFKSCKSYDLKINHCDKLRL